MPWNAVVRGAEARIKAVREAVGPDIDIGLDPHAKIFEPVKALQMAQAVAPYNPYFFEEPLRPENIDAMASFKRDCPIPVATGECLYTKFEFRDLIAREAADIIQPDVCLMRRADGDEEDRGDRRGELRRRRPAQPHGARGDGGQRALRASTPNFAILEYNPDDRGPRRDLVREPLAVKDGYIELPTTPGLGIDLDESAFEKYPYKPWKRTSPIRPDGSIGFN